MSRPHAGEQQLDDDAGDLDDAGERPAGEQQLDDDAGDLEDAGERPADDDDAGEQPADDDGDSFPREYVERLRRKQYSYRHRAQAAERRAEQLSRELYRSRVAELGLLADPDDMEYDDALLMDGAALRAAVTELVRSRPHLAARRVRGNIGQHEQPAGSPGQSLGAILRHNA